MSNVACMDRPPRRTELYSTAPAWGIARQPQWAWGNSVPLPLETISESSIRGHSRQDLGGTVCRTDGVNVDQSVKNSPAWLWRIWRCVNNSRHTNSRQDSPKLRPRDRIFWIWASRIWSNWQSALSMVQPETVIRWHRQGFKLNRRWTSRSGQPGRRVDKVDVAALKPSSKRADRIASQVASRSIAQRRPSMLTIRRLYWTSSRLPSTRSPRRFLERRGTLGSRETGRFR